MTIRTRRGSLLYRALTTTLTSTTDRARVDRSRWYWTPQEVGHTQPDGTPSFPPAYALRPLGILHTLIGLTLDVTP